MLFDITVNLCPPMPTDDASIEKSTYSFYRILLFMKWNLPTLLKKKPTDDLLFSSKSQMKRKTKFAICSLINSVGNVKSKGTEDQIHCEKKKLSTNNGNEVEIRRNRETWGNVEIKSREKGVQSDVLSFRDLFGNHQEFNNYSSRSFQIKCTYML